MKNPLLSSSQVIRFQTRIYAFYKSRKRILPWRTTRDPYKVLVSEVMLQQTQVERVLKKYGRFIDAFPALSSLAGASLRDVLIAWQGLGYNRRARALKRSAEIIVNRFNSRVPGDYNVLCSLPGIGPATASCILAFAFNIPTVFIETNIRAVFIHHYFRGQHAVTDQEILDVVRQTVDKDDPRNWYYALMDYGVFLKKKYANPSRRSAHHTRQSRFEGSDRQLRSAVIRKILAAGPTAEEGLYEDLKQPRQRFDKIIEGLIDDGLLRRRRGVLSV